MFFTINVIFLLKMVQSNGYLGGSKPLFEQMLECY